MAVTVTKPKIIMEMAVYDIGTVIGKNEVSNFLANIERHRPILRSLGVRAVLFSMADNEKFDKDAFLLIAQRYDNLHRELKIPTGVCLYSQKHFSVLKTILEDTSVALFKNINVAALSVGTSRVRKNSGILLYSEDSEDKTMMSSDLISRGYFPIMASSIEDFKKKYEHKESYSMIVTDSKFGGMHDDVLVLFKDNYYLYTIKGLIDEGVFTRFAIKDHNKRLQRGFKVFIFDMTKITAMDMKGTQFFLHLADDALKYGAVIAIFGLDLDKMYSNARVVLEKCSIWLYDTLEDILADPEFTELQNKRILENVNDFRLTKEHASSLALFTSALSETIKTYGKWDVERKKVSIKGLNEFCSSDSIAQSSITFDGDMHGSLLLSFTKETAKLLAVAMTGIEDELPEKEYIDVLNEFVNSVAGKIKTTIVDKKIYINFSLPESNLTKDKKLKGYEDTQGVIAQMTIDDNPLDIMVTAGIL